MQRAPQPHERTLLVIGGGYLGCRIAASSPPRVAVVTRSGQLRSDAGLGTQAIPLDVLTAPLLAIGELLSTATHLIVCYAPDRAEMREQLYLEGASRLTAAAAALPPSQRPRRVVYVSSTSALPDLDEALYEDETRRPTERRGLIQREAEEIFSSWAAACDVSLCIVRLGGLYGPGRTLDRLYTWPVLARQTTSEPSSAPVLPSRLPGDGHTATNLIHIDDAATVCLAALGHEAGSLPRLVHGVDDDDATRREMFERVALACEQPAPRFEEEVAHGQPVRGKKVRSRYLRDTLGVTLRHPVRTTSLHADE